MDYEECLKVADSIFNRTVNKTKSTDLLSKEWDEFYNNLIRLTAEEIFNAFQFGIKWGNEGLNVQVS